LKILVINTGSSSIKYQLFDMSTKTVLASGMAEKIGEAKGLLHHEVILDGKCIKKAENHCFKDHKDAFESIVNLLLDKTASVINDKSEIEAVGHRVVHGGEAFHGTTIIDDDVISAIRDNIPLAPLHNPSNLLGIEVARSVFPKAPQVAVFDTAFHQTIPKKGYIYAIPYELYEKERIRRYGFHGTSHAFVAEEAAKYLERPLSGLNLITIHLGNGASITAIKNGCSIDTTMGMTPLAGLVMGTRSGDVDPALPFFLADHLGMSFKEIDKLLNNESGLKGLCGTNDMREVVSKVEDGDEQARLAVAVYCYRIKKYIGSYFAALERLDAIIFTAGIGENSSYIREVSCSGLEKLGIELDHEKNNKPGNGVREVSKTASEVKVLVIPTNEELRIAQETERAINQGS
jgi:acetate kinase